MIMTALKFPLCPRYDEYLTSPAELQVGHLISNFNVWDLKDASTEPENNDFIDGSDFLITKAGVELNLTMGTRHWSVELMNKAGEKRTFVSAKPLNEDTVEVSQSRTPIV
ncbi:MAG: hypothetical protein H9W81_13420 [Enterococcus sp.]|nr:hypothetical protein [Enterococcus sp.]